MKKIIKVIAIITVLLIGVLSIHSFSSKKVSLHPEKIKVALRAVGDKLLRDTNDYTSLVLPVKELSDYIFELSFQKKISIDPEALVDIIDAEFKKRGFPQNYITEVIHCATKEVSYSYEMLGHIQENEIPCLERKLPVNCYTIKIIISEDNIPTLYSAINNKYTLSIVALLFILITGTTLLNRKQQKDKIQGISSDFIVLGTLLFYPDQQKLCKDQTEISLTVKESELLTILVQYSNQIVKRELLTKRVWEDNGVIVGRSLDMFISKLRKKLSEDSEVNIVNIHGVGYRLELPSKK